MIEKTINIAKFISGDKGMPIDDVGELLIENSKLNRTNMFKELRGGYFLDNIEPLAQSATRSVRRNPVSKEIPLSGVTKTDRLFSDVVLKRRSAREFGNNKLTTADISTVLNIGMGVTGYTDLENGTRQNFRTVPSGGALFPIELYAYSFGTEDLEKGIYHFDPEKNCLHELVLGNFDEALAEASSQPDYFENVQMALVVVGVFSKTRFKYGRRGVRFGFMEAGHVTQNLVLGSEYAGLSSVILGGFYDNEIEELFHLDGVDDVPLSIILLGTKKTNN